MIRKEEQEEIYLAWKAKFPSAQAFDRCWADYWRDAFVPDCGRLEAWLRKGLDAANARAEASRLAGASFDDAPVYPTRQHYATSECPHCRGRGYVRRDVAVGHADFGKAFKCPDCNGGNRAKVTAPTGYESAPPRGDTWCLHCGRPDTEPAGEGCKDWSGWHYKPAV